MRLCSFDNHPRVRIAITCDHEAQTCSFNGQPACRLCYDAFRIAYDIEDKRFRADVAACLDCQLAELTERERIQNDCTIDRTQPYGQHIGLTCRNHPTLTWSTKNIDYIGARSIFFNGFHAIECSCPMSDLILIPKTP